MQSLQNRHGFTLMELMIVLAIMGLVIAPLFGWVVLSVRPLDWGAIALFLAMIVWFVQSVGYLFLWIHRKRRARMSRRLDRGLCPQCKYPIRGARAANCPECGRYLGMRMAPPRPARHAPVDSPE